MKDAADTSSVPEQGKPLISVVVPVYNARSTLAATAASILAQTYKPLEIILVNDGSTDGSGELCHEIAAAHANVRVIDQENQGLSAARNSGIRAAGGSLLGFVDSDDLITPDMYACLERGYEKALAQGRRDIFIQIGREEIDEEGNRLPDAVTPPRKAEYVSSVDFMKRLLLYTGDVSFCTRLCPAGLMRAHPFEKGVLAEDFSLQMKLTEECEGMLLLPEVGYRVVHRKGSLTRRANPTQFSPAYIAIVQHADYVEQVLVPRHQELAAAAGRFGLYERLDYLLHVPIPDMSRENDFYQGVIRYLRQHFAGMWTSRGLTLKNKIYLTLFTLCPRFTREVHWKLRGKQILANP